MIALKMSSGSIGSGSGGGVVYRNGAVAVSAAAVSGSDIAIFPLLPIHARCKSRRKGEKKKEFLNVCRFSL